MLATRHGPKPGNRPTQAQLRSRWVAIDPDTAAVIQRVKEYLQQHCVSVTELARRCGMKSVALYQHLSPLRSGLGPMRITLIRALAKECGKTLHEMLDP